MITALILAAGVWLSDPTRYCFQEPTETYPSCAYQVGTVTEVIDQTTIENTIWQYRGFVWKGNPFCAELGLFPSAPPTLNDQGELVDPKQIGACVVTDMPDAPTQPVIVEVN